MTSKPAQEGGIPAPGATNADRGPVQRPYQRDQLQSVCDGLAAGLNRLLIKSPTGTGKTVMFAGMLEYPGLKAWLQQFPVKERQMLVIAHREELLDQAAEKIRKQNPGLYVCIEQGDRHASRYSDVVIASIQTLAAMKFRRLKKLTDWFKFRIVIVDEAHHAAASTYRAALVHLGFLPSADDSDRMNIEAVDYDDIAVMEEALKGWDARAPKDRLLVGVTATPNRSDAVGLSCVFQSLAYSYDLKQAIADGWLVPIKAWIVESGTSLDAVRVTAGEFNQKDLAIAVNTDRRNQMAVAAWHDHALAKSTIAFTVDVAHAHSLAEAFQAEGYKAMPLSGETPKEERRLLLRQYLEGQIDIITNCMILTEGSDLPRTECILHAKPTKSATLYEQMSGRGLRLHPGKTECIIIDVADIARRHSLQTAPVLYGLPPNLKTLGKELDEMQREYEEFRAAFQHFNADAALETGRMTLEGLRARAESYNVWAIPDLGSFGEGRELGWMRFGEDTYQVQYPWADGIETLTVARDMVGQWDLSLTLKPKGGAALRQRTLAAHIATSVAAAALGEAFVKAERHSVQKLAGKDEPWRGHPVSQGQLRVLISMKIPHDPKTLTKGEASNLITLAQSRRGQRR